MSKFTLPWKTLFVGQHVINGGTGALWDVTDLETSIQLTLRGDTMPTVDVRLELECSSCNIYNDEDDGFLFLQLQLSFSRPMSRRLCQFWNRKNGYCSRHQLVIEMDRSNKRWNQQMFTSLVHCLVIYLPFGIVRTNSEPNINQVLEAMKHVPNSKDPATTVVALFGGKGGEVTLQSFRRLKDERLNDELMQFGFWFFYEAAIRKQASLRNSIKVFSTYFVTKMRTDGPESVFSWTKSFDVFQLDYIAIPVHTESKDHWYLILVDHPGRILLAGQQCQIIVLDSLNQKYPQDVQLVQNWLSELASKTQGHQGKAKISVISTQVPQQSNDKDCGIYALNVFKRFLEEPTAFAQGFEVKLNAAQIDNKWAHSEVSNIRGMLRKGLLELSFRNWVLAPCIELALLAIAPASSE